MERAPFVTIVPTIVTVQEKIVVDWLIWLPLLLLNRSVAWNFLTCRVRKRPSWWAVGHFRSVKTFPENRKARKQQLTQIYEYTITFSMLYSFSEMLKIRHPHSFLVFKYSSVTIVLWYFSNFSSGMPTCTNPNFHCRSFLTRSSIG